MSMARPLTCQWTVMSASRCIRQSSQCGNLEVRMSIMPTHKLFAHQQIDTIDSKATDQEGRKLLCSACASDHR
eukprot:scaffold663533_cov59-Prasinocladus_malaysianus.AAC.1